MRIYIAGPMTGLPEHNYPAFHAAARAWRDAGWDVANPAENFGGEQGRPYREYVRADVETLKSCDAIAMLPGWADGHSGAIWEHEIATQLLHLPVFDAGAPCCALDAEHPVTREQFRQFMNSFLDEVL